jgi:hypothetical protein
VEKIAPATGGAYVPTILRSKFIVSDPPASDEKINLLLTIPKNVSIAFNGTAQHTITSSMLLPIFY